MTPIHLEELPVAAFAAGPGGVLGACNQLFANLLDRRPDEVCGMTHAALSVDDADVLATVRTQGDRPCVLRHRYRARDGGEPITVDLTLRARRYGDDAGFIGTAVPVGSAPSTLPDPFTATLDGLRYSVVVIGADGRIRFMNRFGLELQGLTRDQCAGMHVLEGPWVRSDDARQAAENLFGRAVAGEEVRAVVPVDRGGHRRLLEAVLSPVVDESDRVVQIFARAIDVTEQILAEQARRESEENLRDLLATTELAQGVAHVGTFRRELRTGVTHWSKELYRIFGVDAEATPATFERFQSVLHPDDRPAVNAAVARLLEADSTDGEPETVEYRIVRPDGEVRHVQSFIALDRAEGRESQLIGATMDVTDRHRREAVVRNQAHLLDLVFRHSVDCMALMDADYNFIRVSESYARVSGDRAANDYPGHNHFDLFPSAAREEFDEAIRAGGIYQRFARPFVYPDEPERGTTWWDITLVPIRDDAGEVELLLMTLKDVTGHVRAERRLQAVLETTTDGILEMEVGSGVVQVSRRIVDLLQLDPEVAERGIAWEDLLAMIVDSESFEQAFRACVEARGSMRGEYEMIRGDGTRIQVEGSGQVLSPELADDPSLRAVGSLRDITGRKTLERQLNQLQKLRALGQFAGGVAHDFNNLLSVVLGTVEVIRESLDAGPPFDTPQIRHDLDALDEAAHSGTGMIRKLLAFGQRQAVQLQPFNMAAALVDMEPLLRRLIREDIILRVETPPDPWPVMGDPALLEQVMMNLVTNARDAMPGGGQLTIRAVNRGFDTAAVRPAGLDAGEYLELSVSDTGTGMPAEVMERIFEPFFTTRGSEDGHGLGLSTVHGLVQLCGGQVRVASEPGGGTTFTMYFPRTVAVAPESDPVPVSPVAPPSEEPQCILLCEDSEDLRRLLGQTLRDSGYRVLEAGDGRRGVELAREFAEPIHLMVTDVVMPHLNGHEAALQVRELYPDLPVLLLTGYAHGVIDEDNLPTGFDLLSKPITPSMLRQRVKKLLARVR